MRPKDEPKPQEPPSDMVIRFTAAALSGAAVEPGPGQAASKEVARRAVEIARAAELELQRTQPGGKPGWVVEGE